jgi:hypothetical protein
MYAVGIVLGNGGFCVPCGNNGLQKLHNKTVRGWKSETQIMSKYVDEVWVVPDFTQEMCEMNNGKLVDHVRAIGKRIY